jgi:hypothetical protein
MALPERIRAEIEASFADGPEPPSVADVLAAGRRLQRRRRIGALAVTVAVTAALVTRTAAALALQRARGGKPPQEQP